MAKDNVNKRHDVKLAEKLAENFAANWDDGWGMCGFGDSICQDLKDVLRERIEEQDELFNVTPEEREELRSRGFSDEFIDAFVGVDGRKIAKRHLDLVLGGSESCRSIPKIWSMRESVLEIFSAMLEDDDPKKRMRALDCLAEIGALAIPLFAKVVAMLDDNDREVVQRTMYAILSLGREMVGSGGTIDRALLPKIMSIITNADGYYPAYCVLEIFGRDAAEAALKEYKKGRIGRDLFCNICKILEKNAVPALDELVEILKNDPGELKRDIIDTIATMGKEARRAKPSIFDMLEADTVNGGDYAWLIANIGIEASELSRVFKVDETGRYLMDAVARSDDPDMPETILKALERGDDVLFLEKAAYVVSEAGSEMFTEEHIPRLIRAFIRLEASFLDGKMTSRAPSNVLIQAIYKIGKIAAPYLIEACKDPKVRSETREWLLNVLGSVMADPELVIPAILEALDSNDENLINGAIYALRFYDKKFVVSAMPRLMELLKGDKCEIKSEVARFIMKSALGVDGAFYLIPELQMMVKEEKCPQALDSALEDLMGWYL